MTHKETPSEPGWYQDPKGRRGMELYWDGERWTGAPREKAPQLTSSGILLIVVGTIVGTIVIGLLLRSYF